MEGDTLDGLVAELVPFVGRWEGMGWETSPAGSMISYREEIELLHCGGPVLSYRQASYDCDGQLIVLIQGFLTASSPPEIRITFAASEGEVETGSGNLWREGEWTIARLTSDVYTYPDLPMTDANERLFTMRGDLMFANFDILYESGNFRRKTARLHKVVDRR